MKQKIAYLIWGIFYCLCAGLGHIANTTPVQSTALTIVSVLFFIPGFYLLVDAKKNQKSRQLKYLRIIGLSSLGLTFLMILANIASVLASETLGNVLYEILIFVSVPMIASRHWVLSLFLWAFFTICTFEKKVTAKSKQDQK